MANKKRIAKAFGTTLLASAMTASAIVPAFAGQQLGATNFNNGVGLPWHICESGANTSLKFEIANGVYKIWILNPGGIDRGGESWWDAQFRHRKISIAASHTYEISYTITSNMAGSFKTKIGDFSGNIESWHNDMGGSDNKNHGMSWDALKLTANTTYEFSGSFTPSGNPGDHAGDVDAAEWAFQFGGQGEYNTGGDAFPASSWYSQSPSYKTEVVDGKERYKTDSSCPSLIFDDMSLIDTTNSENDWGGAINPYDDATHNAVRVNQIGYYTNLQKKATVVLADDDTKSYGFEVKDSTGATVFSGTTSSGGYDPDSGQWVAVLDFSNFKEAGDGYYIQMGSGYTAPSAAGVVETAIGSTRSYPFTISDNLYAEVKPSDGKPVESDGTTYSDEYSTEKKGVKTRDAIDYTIAGENSLFTNAFNYFYQNRATIEIESEYITSGDNKTPYPGVGTPSTEDMFDGTLAGKAGLARKPNLGFDSGYIQTTWVKSYGAVSNVQTSNGELTDLDKGWFDAGDCGKYVVNGGISAWTLANTYEMALRNGTEDELNELCVVPEDGGDYNDCLDEVKWELDLFLDMVVEAGDAEQKPYIDGETNGAAMDMTGLVYHKFHDYKWTGLALAPELDGLTRVVKPPSTAATLNAVATFAQGARLFGGSYADTLLAAAESSYEAAKTIKFQNDYIYAPLDQAIGGGAYGDSEVRDDFYWAACELYATTGDSKYWDDINEFEIPSKTITVTNEADGSSTEVQVAGQEKFKLTTDLGGGENKGSFTSFNWGCTAGLGTLTLYLALSEGGTQAGKQDAALEIIEQSIQETADIFMLEQTFDPTASRGDDNTYSASGQGYGIPYNGAAFTDDINAPGQVFDGYEWGSNSFVINNSIVMAYAYQISQDAKYMNGVITSMDYLLGRNAMDYSYITGYGEFHLVYPHHRYWSHENDANYPYAPAGVLSGGPNLGMQDPYIKGAGFDPTGTPSQFCYIDSAESWSTNEITINWNSPLVWITKYLNDNAASADGTVVPPDDDKPKTTTTAKTPDTGDVSYGDVDLDGKQCDITDVVLLGKHVSGKLTLNSGSKNLTNANVNQGDVAVNVDDLKTVIDVMLGAVSKADLPVK